MNAQCAHDLQPEAVIPQEQAGILNILARPDDPPSALGCETGRPYLSSPPPHLTHGRLATKGKLPTNHVSMVVLICGGLQGERRLWISTSASRVQTPKRRPS